MVKIKPMPVNYLHINEQINRMGAQTRQRQLDFEQRKFEAFECLQAYNNRTDELNERIRSALETSPSFRCALPGGSPLMAVGDAPETDQDCVIWAADGSQITPNFHDPVPFGVINIGAFRLATVALNQPPGETVFSRLLDEDELNGEHRITEDIMALKRDLDERSFLAELASQETLPVVSLTDGPLELFLDPKERSEYRRMFDDYLSALQKLASPQTAAAGYIDRPRSDLIIRSLELTKLGAADLKQAGRNRPFQGIKDVDLFEKILQPGQRSAIFAIQSPSAAKFTGELALFFFYLNVGFTGDPSLARVEVPAWVVNQPGLLSLLHTCLVKQCRMLGSRPYPYALHRAHETAVVHASEKEEISNMIIRELNLQGRFIKGSSNKQIHKDESNHKGRVSI